MAGDLLSGRPYRADHARAKRAATTQAFGTVAGVRDGEGWTPKDTGVTGCGKAAISERDARRAQSDALHRAAQEIGDERLAARMDQAMRRFLAGTYYVTLSRGTGRRPGDENARRDA